jgi:hypothetical protein
MTIDTYLAELRAQASQVLADHPELPHEWRGRGDLAFPAVDADGFDVILQPDARGIIVLTGTGLHEHIEAIPAEAVQDAMGLARDLLSVDMRIRERRAGGRGYHWTLERRAGDGWRMESRTGLLVWNYLARRSEHVYQNQQLPGRLVGTPEALTGRPGPEGSE